MTRFQILTSDDEHDDSEDAQADDDETCSDNGKTNRSKRQPNNANDSGC